MQLLLSPSHISQPVTSTGKLGNSLQSLARHLQIVVPLWFRETLEVYQTRMEFLVVIPELCRKTIAGYTQIDII